MCDLYCGSHHNKTYWGTYKPMNTVKDFRVLENQPDIGNISLRQNINVRRARLANDSTKDLLIGIDISNSCNPRKKFVLHAGEVRDLGVNMPDEPIQFIWIYDPVTGELYNNPHPIRRHVNQLAIKEGANNFWIMDFKQATFRPAF